MENVADTQYSEKYARTEQVQLASELEPFLRPSCYVDYAEGDDCVALAVSALCENLALLLGAGIQLDEAAGLLCEDSAAGPFREAARTMQKALLLGKSLSSAVEKTGALPGHAVRMIAAGEKAGRTEPVLNSLARYLRFAGPPAKKAAQRRGLSCGAAGPDGRHPGGAAGLGASGVHRCV